MTEENGPIAVPVLKLSYDDALALVGTELKKRLTDTPALVRPLTVHLSRAPGKGIRASALLACALERGGAVPGDAVKLAAAVELLHLATLVHDDILDDANKRRSVTTLHRKFSLKQAVLCGDYLFCLALRLASEAEPREDRRPLADSSLLSCLTDILLGEMSQDRNIGNLSLSERRYFEIIRGKTAALFEGACYAGFLLSDEPESAGSAFREIGRNTGLVFQLADDCADYESSRKASGKPVLSDLKAGVVTLPLIRALRADKGLLARVKAYEKPSALKKAVASAGGLVYARRKISEYAEKTASLIGALPSGPDKKDRLSGLLEQAAGMPLGAAE